MLFGTPELGEDPCPAFSSTCPPRADVGRTPLYYYDNNDSNNNTHNYYLN